MSRANLFKEVDGLLRGRPGWKLQGTTAPGAAPVWCFPADGEVELTVSAERTSINVYEMEADRGTTLDGTDSLAAWLKAWKEESFADRPTAEGPGRSGRRRRSFLQW